jgi:hypothetical protein
LVVTDPVRTIQAVRIILSCQGMNAEKVTACARLPAAACWPRLAFEICASLYFHTT